MIKFFRKIRQKLIEKNKVRNYFFYAIGEIILVVIGILIALQINNWNENRIARIAERELYELILADLQIHENRIVEQIDYYNKNQSMHKNIYEDTKGLLVNDSLIDLSTLRSAQVFNLVLEANYSKYIKDISETKIREKLDQYFKLEDFVKDANQMLYNFKEDKLKPFLSEYGINNTKELYKYYHLDYYKLREKNVISYSKLKEQYGSTEFDQLLFDLGIKTSWAITALNNALIANKELQFELKNKLNR